MIDSITFGSNLDISLLIVDNSDSVKDSNLFNKVKSSSFISLINPGYNLGYFGAAQYGLEHIKNYGRLADFTIISNPDLIYSADFFKHLNKLRIESNIGVIAPKVINHPSCTNANPYFSQRPTRQKIRFLRRVHSNVYTLLFYTLLFEFKRKLVKKKQSLEQEYIYAPHGSCIIFCKKYFEHNCEFKFPGFLFGEEIFVGETCRNLNLKIIIDNNLVVNHYEHSSIGKLKSKSIANYARHSLKILEDDFFK
ncbi:hypothetical protein [Colwellia sp. C1TZA3]|uniref:hypothetical protein n=1 Tax=Colwellia sp. C1TZA3 TaxID=2508879 RepID=UPI0011BA318D|nr:hypothetical protein [Colwellia sp. C1TZA3]TWX72954.1 hypothetical protein ESZ39_06430 [Colwellia sp. C1TZA3]